MSTVTLISKEGEKFTAPVEIRKMCLLINDIVEDMEDDLSEDIPLATVSSKYLTAILDYCKNYNYAKEKTDIKHPLISNKPSEFLKDAWELSFI